MQKKGLLTLLVILTVLTGFYLWYRAGNYFWVEVWFMIEILILTSLTRTVSWRRLLAAFMRGISIAAVLTMLFYLAFSLIGAPMKSAFMSGWVMGTLEELFKFLPVLFIIYFLYRGRKVLPNLSDWLVLSVLAGAGFSLVEKALWSGVNFPFTYGPHLGQIYFFPDALGIYVKGQAFGYLGHAAATGLIGMSVGLAFWLKQRIKNNLVWILPAVITLWVIIEHALLNAYYADGTTGLLMFGGGQLTPWLFIILLIALLAIDGYNLWKFLVRKNKAKELVWLQLKKQQYIKFFQTLRIYNFIISKNYK